MSVRLAIGFCLMACVGGCGLRPPKNIRIATGMRGGTFLPLGETLARAFADDAPSCHFTALESPGSVASLEMLENGEAELALVSNHVPASSAVRLIAVLYEETLQIVVRADAGISTPFDLRGHPIAIGPEGSGTEGIASTVLHHFGIQDEQLDRRNMSLSDAADAMEAGTLDGVFVVAGMRTPIVDRLLSRGDMRLLSLGDASRVGSSLDGIRLDAPYFAVSTIPEHAYGREPTEPVGTITVRALLVARADLDDALIFTLTSSLFQHKVELAGEQQLLAHLTEQFDRSLSPYAPHPGAESYFRREEPSFVHEHVDEIGLGITLAAILWSALSALAAARKARRRDRVEARFKEVQSVAKRGREARDLATRSEALAALREARDRSILELAEERLDANESFVILQQYLDAQIAELRHAPAPKAEPEPDAGLD